MWCLRPCLEKKRHTVKPVDLYVHVYKARPLCGVPKEFSAEMTCAIRPPLYTSQLVQSQEVTIIHTTKTRRGHATSIVIAQLAYF